jgi:hypothetical protein
MAKYRHLTEDQRFTIAYRLKGGETFRSIGAEIGKDPSTVAKEIKNHITVSQTGCSGHAYNNCKNRRGCKESHVCTQCTNWKLMNRCWACKMCNYSCGHYEPDHCAKLDKPPYVCNGCPDRQHKCSLEKRFYYPQAAQAEYKNTLSESRAHVMVILVICGSYERDYHADKDAEYGRSGSYRERDAQSSYEIHVAVVGHEVQDKCILKILPPIRDCQCIKIHYESSGLIYELLYFKKENGGNKDESPPFDQT